MVVLPVKASPVSMTEVNKTDGVVAATCALSVQACESVRRATVACCENTGRMHEGAAFSWSENASLVCEPITPEEENTLLATGRNCELLMSVRLQFNLANL